MIARQVILGSVLPVMHFAGSVAFKAKNLTLIRREKGKV